jgi:2-methylcitrate dehydratase PrpD
VGQVQKTAAALGQSAESSVIGGGRLSLAGATLLNGYLITAVSMCDVHPVSDAHLTPAVTPPALAMAEQRKAGGRDLLVALAAGFETLARIGLGIDYKEFAGRGWNSSGVIGPFGAAASAGRLMGLSPEQMAFAFGIAGSQGAGTRLAKGTPTIKFHQCRSALSGLLAAMLAEQGFVAPRDFLDNPQGGLFPLYCGDAKKSLAAAKLGESWAMGEVGLRLWPCPSSTLGVVTALFTLIDQGLKFTQVRRVRVGMAAGAFATRGLSENIAGKLQAVNSVYYATAAALHDGALWLDQFKPERFNDPELRKFAAEKVEILSDDQLQGAQAWVEVETDEGKILKSRCVVPKGSPGNSPTQEDIRTKFLKASAHRLSGSRAQEILETVARLEELESAGRLLDLLSQEGVEKHPK